MLTLPNAQAREKPDHRADGSLDVVGVWGTLQGEGPFVGAPAVFVRLAGCNLTCPGCDTDYTSNRARKSVADIVTLVMSECHGNTIGLAVLTGGEPFRQNVGPLCRALIVKGFEVQIETNGSLDPGDDFPYLGVHVVCSPKTPVVHSSLMPYVRALKYVVADGQVDPADGLPSHTLGNQCGVCKPWPGFRGEVFVAPQDDQDKEANAANVEVAVKVCLKFGYRLSIQQHKVIGLE